MKQALIFAAGRGERLRPLTQKIPKALCPLGGIPIIEYTLQALAKAGIQTVWINHAYLGDQIKRHVGHGARFGLNIHYLAEPPGGLETGGTLIYLQQYLDDAPFIALNADVYTDYPLETLPPPQAYAHLVLVPCSPLQKQGDFGLSPLGQVIQQPRYLFSGIASYQASIFKTMTLQRTSITPFLRTWINEGRVSGEVYQGTWHDIGSRAQLTQAESDLHQHLNRHDA